MAVFVFVCVWAWDDNYSCLRVSVLLYGLFAYESDRTLLCCVDRRVCIVIICSQQNRQQQAATVTELLQPPLQLHAESEIESAAAAADIRRPISVRLCC